MDKLAELVETRPAECLLFGQRVIDNFGVLDRVAALRLNGHLNGKRIVLLGDDDLVSLGIAMLGTPDRLTVLDLDERLLSFIQGTADRFGLALEAVCYDCADQLPADFSASYDVVLCDPYPTYDASFEAFFWTQTRGLLDPRGDRSVYSFVAPSHKPPDFADASLAWIGKNGGISVERVSGFNAYLLIEGELTGAEASCLQGLVWEPKLSHTKDLVRFEWSVSEDASIPDGAARPSGQPRTDETMGWIDGVLGHALVTTMGVEEQLQIATAATAHTPRWQGALRPLGQHGTASVGGRSGLRSRGTITVKLDGLIFEIWGASKLQEWQARPGDVASLLSTTEAGALELTPADLCFLTELHHSGVQPVDVEAGRRADLFSLTRLFESYHRSTVKAAF